MSIVISDVTVKAQQRTLLEGLSLTLNAHRTAIIGANGSGKSTSLRLCIGLVEPAAGTVNVCGLDVARETRAVRRKVGFLFQNPDAQIVMPTPLEDVAFGLKPLGLRKDERERKAREALARMGLTGREDSPAHLLSGGEKQRLALAGILAVEPEVLLVDEPTTFLDLAGSLLFRGLLRTLPQQVVLATHDLDLATECDQVVVLDGGRVVTCGTPGASIPVYRELVEQRTQVA